MSRSSGRRPTRGEPDLPIPSPQTQLASSQICDRVSLRDLAIVFWTTENGACDVREFLRSEPIALRKQFGAQVEAKRHEFLARGHLTWDGVSFKQFCATSGVAGEVRVKVAQRQARFFVGLDGSVPELVVLHGFWKSGESWKRIDLPKAATRWRQYQAAPTKHGRG